MNRLGLKIGCLLASVFIWIQVASHATVEQSARLPLVVVGLGEDLTLAGSVLPDEVDVRLEGSKLALVLHDLFNRYIGEVRVNLWDRGPGPEFTYEISRSDVYSDLRVVDIQSAEIRGLRIDRLEYHLLPVRQVNTGKLREGLAFLEPPVLQPDSVLVSGPGRFFTEHTGVKAEPVDLARIKESRRIPVKLVSPSEYLELANRQVNLVVQVGPLEETTLANVPVVALVDAGRPAVAISPPLVDVMVRGVRDSVLGLQSHRFLVTVPVGDLPEGNYQLEGQIDHPPWLEIVGMDPPDFQVIVGHPSVPLDSVLRGDGAPAGTDAPDSTAGVASTARPDSADIVDGFEND